MQSTTTTGRARRGAALLALAASGLLIASCGTSGDDAPQTPTSEEATVEPSDDGGQSIDEAEPSGGGSDDGGVDDGSGDISDGETEGGDQGNAGQLPEGWEGTISAETVGEAGGVSYLAAQNLYGEHQQATEMGPDELVTTEFLGGYGADCDGTASLAGDTSTCSLTDEAGERTAVVHLVPAAFGSSMLLIGVGDADPGELNIPQDVVLGFSRVDAGGDDAITEESVEEGAMNAVMLAEAPDGDVPAGLKVACTLEDGSEHAACEVTGTPDGGGDGFWYATPQPGPGSANGNAAWYLFSKLPA